MVAGSGNSDCLLGTTHRYCGLDRNDGHHDLEEQKYSGSVGEAVGGDIVKPYWGIDLAAHHPLCNPSDPSPRSGYRTVTRGAAVASTLLEEDVGLTLGAGWCRVVMLPYLYDNSKAHAVEISSSRFTIIATVIEQPE